MHDELTEAMRATIEKHFNIAGIINVNYYGRHPLELSDKINKIKKQEYDDKDRVVLLLEDHDYYLNGQGPGFQLYNVQLALSQHDIPNYFCLLVTNQPNYDEYTRMVQKQLTTDDIHIRSITTMLDDSLSAKAYPRQDNVERIEKAYCILSRQGRSHRTYFMSRLFEAGIQHAGLIGYNNIPYQDAARDTLSDSNVEKVDLGYLIEPAHLPPLLIDDPAQRLAFATFALHHPSYKNFEEKMDLSDKEKSADVNSDNPIQRALIYVGLETQHNLAKTFMSRISMRGIVERRPFIILGIPGTLQRLRDAGFKTFDKFWDESYDLEPRLAKRTDMLIKILEDHSSMSNEDIRTMYQSMLPLIEHNHRYYHHDHIKVQTERFDRDCRANLLGR